jgi:hypothetical protein
MRDLKHRAAFEQHGETYVRVLAKQPDDVGREASAWLEEKQVAREEQAAKQRDTREEETLRIARRANWIAMGSVVVAAASAIIALVAAMRPGN